MLSARTVESRRLNTLAFPATGIISSHGGVYHALISLVGKRSGRRVN